MAEQADAGAWSEPPLLDPQSVDLAALDVVVLDVQPAVADYLAEHVRGALHCDLDRDLAAVGEATRGGRHPLPDLEQWCRRLGSWGIEPDTQVLAYDRSGGAHAAARAWWMLRAAGVRRARVIDGGLEGARAAGWPVDDGEDAQPTPVTFALPQGGEWLLPLVLIEEVEEIRLRADRCLLDVRSAERYRGDSEPFDPVAGHIPGARNLPYAEALDADKRFLSPEVLRQRIDAALGAVPPERAAVYCGSGVTACHALLSMTVAGRSGASLYVGSWSEWCRQPGSPRARIGV